MKKIIEIILFLVLLSTTASAQTTLPKATPQLICTNANSELIIGICGVNGCSATVRQADGIRTFNVKRKRYPSGALDYVPGPKATDSCTFKISALRIGVRRVINTPSCAPALNLARCRWLYP